MGWVIFGLTWTRPNPTGLPGLPWIDSNGIFLSTLHQVTKYVDKQGEVRVLVADRHPFRGVEKYFTDFILYQDLLKIGPETEEPDSGNKANAELESDNDCPREFDLSVICQTKLDVNHLS